MTGQRFHRKVIRIRATDSPNVRLAFAQRAQGIEPTNDLIVPGVLTWEEYQHRLAVWDKVRQCIGLQAEFYLGAEELLFPPDWLDHAERKALELMADPPRGGRQALAMGVDPGEGEAETAWAIGDVFGLMELQSKKTPDTSLIEGETIALINRFGIDPEAVLFDRGGGGFQIANNLRSRGYNVKTIPFGSAPTLPIKRGRQRTETRQEIVEERYVFVNLRAQMYGELSEALEVREGNQGWGIPAAYHELRRQLAPMPRLYDKEGRLYMLPKNRIAGSKLKPNQQTLCELLGCSPDQADATVLCHHAVMHPTVRRKLLVG